MKPHCIIRRQGIQALL